MRILIVDDRPSVRDAVADLIRRHAPDLTVVGTAEDGPEALRLTERLRPDVVLMDMRLPGMSGLEATRAIRASYPTVRVVGLSMYLQCKQRDQMLEAGATAYVTKTAPADVLLQAIRKAAP